MNSLINIRVRHPQGQTRVELNSNASLYDLKQQIAQKLNTKPSVLIIKLGFPPKPIEIDDKTTLENLNIEDGMQVVAEIDEDAIKEEPPSKPQEKPSSGSNNNDKKDAGIIPEQVPDPDGLIMIRRIIPADNSCLFNSIDIASKGSRKTVPANFDRSSSGYVLSEPDRYTSDFLFGKSNEDYAQWIQKDSSWGGAIELEIFSRHYKVEICAVDISQVRASVYGSDQKYDHRVYVMYDGIHYDAMARNISEDMDEKMDKVIFNPADQYAYDGALALAKQLNAKKAYTDTSSFTL
eukprot:CAMPEP_0114589502 /NCGR_PEP_ID=MMETSP0125-20121206/11925_1 /TAXON_ID=485358 ORGANISM="Aristerostoma sp., Strain ATCC 50986" /NCGR_SAMPLE_ID=MMETSP0125 /ASSEMBLY_ACC=CAM_ASM_000245 /LENGTH=292 /DNA_ID=CAMNT_0001786403 /DNA_START=66 /DNA_END=944 /DNA_ORIENTATION=-